MENIIPLGDALEEVVSNVLDAAFHVHRTLGPGMLESAYQLCLASELRRRGIRYGREVPVTVHFNNEVIDGAFRADFIVEDRVLLELKAVEQLAKVHFVQVVTYLKLANIDVGYLINFNVPLLKDGVSRILHPRLLTGAKTVLTRGIQGSGEIKAAKGGARQV